MTGLQAGDGSDCAPGPPQGNYIMYERATDGGMPNNDDFSKCSRDLVGPVLVARAPICFTSNFSISLS
jgi:hypothetical protein